jgi:uncharacterized repeat protein (TIGR03847 family)
MERARFDYGSATSVDAEAVGQPGQRRFRLLVRSSNGAASVWMEKEQLSGIGDWFQETAERLDTERPSDDPDVEPLPFPADFDLEFRAVQVALGFDEESQQFAFQAFDAVAEPGAAQPHFSCRLSRGQARVLSRRIAAVVSAGRPICPLCEQPMDPAGHACPRANGHRANVTLR